MVGRIYRIGQWVKDAGERLGMPRLARLGLGIRGWALMRPVRYFRNI